MFRTLSHFQAGNQDIRSEFNLKGSRAAHAQSELELVAGIQTRRYRPVMMVLRRLHDSYVPFDVCFTFHSVRRSYITCAGRGKETPQGSSSENQSENDSSVVDIKLEQLELSPTGGDYMQAREQGMVTVRYRDMQ